MAIRQRAHRANWVAERWADARPPMPHAVEVACRGSARAGSVARDPCRAQCHRMRPSAPHSSRVSPVARRGQRGLLRSGAVTVDRSGESASCLCHCLCLCSPSRARSARTRAAGCVQRSEQKKHPSFATIRMTGSTARQCDEEREKGRLYPASERVGRLAGWTLAQRAIDARYERKLRWQEESVQCRDTYTPSSVQ